MPGLMSRIRRRLFETAARKPSGWLGRVVYGSLARLSSFDRLALDKLQLKADDRYLEIGQGGGGLLAQALKIAASGAAIDHSPDMVALARRRNAAAIADGRCEIVAGDAEALPWPDGTFTSCACVATFLFFERPVEALREIRRVLAPGGRVVVITPGEDSPAFLKGLQSSEHGVRLYTPEAFERLLGEAGFADWRVATEAQRTVALARRGE